MSNMLSNAGGCGLARSKAGSEAIRRKPLRVMLGGGPGFADHTAQRLRQLGWDVCTAVPGDNLYTLAAKKNPTAIVLPVEAGGESGFLACAKLRLTRPRLRVVLVGSPTPQIERLAGFVGARFATEADAADVVLKLI